MRAGAVVLSLTLSVATSFAAPPSSDLARMVQTEYDFNDACARNGFKSAFLQFLAQDAIMFFAGPVNGHERIAQRPDIPGKLQWYPSYAVMSSSGTLGLSTGPWVYQAEGQPPAHGHFVTVWRKEKDGSWRSALDVGVDHDKPQTAPTPLKVETLTQQQDKGAKAPGTSIEAAEQQFARRVAEQGYRKAVEAVAHAELRIYRDRHLPSSDRKLLDSQSELAGEVTRNAAIAAGDFGYGYGVTGSAIYTHVWKHEADGWKLLLDLLKPVQ